MAAQDTTLYVLLTFNQYIGIKISTHVTWAWSILPFPDRAGLHHVHHFVWRMSDSDPTKLDTISCN
jgi:hypothetical protein